MTEMDKLEKGLAERGINYLRRPLNGGEQILVYDDKEELQWDAVCGPYTYGGPEGLLETMGLNFPDECDDDVTGYLTADQILEVL
jgi:hypothetical protein